jgi:hypothetical protein
MTDGSCVVLVLMMIGPESFHIDTRLSTSLIPAPDCQVMVDEFGQGSAIVPIAFTSDGGATTPPPAFAGAFPTLLTIRFQVIDTDKTYVEVEGNACMQTQHYTPSISTCIHV